MVPPLTGVPTGGSVPYRTVPRPAAALLALPPLGVLLLLPHAASPRITPSIRPAPASRLARRRGASTAGALRARLRSIIQVLLRTDGDIPHYEAMLTAAKLGVNRQG